MMFETDVIENHVVKTDNWNPSKVIPNEKISYIDLSSIDKEKKVLVEELVQIVPSIDAPSRARQKTKKGDILVATVRPNLNSVAIIKSDLKNLTSSTGYSVLRPKESLDKNFLFYWLQTKSFINDMVKKATGANYPAVSDSIIKKSKIPLPPLGTQKKIAAILDAADAHRQKTKQLLAKYDELAQSIFLDMFGDPVTNPKGWDVMKMGEVLELITYGLTVRPKYYKTGVPLISAKEIRSGYLDLENAARISKADFDSLSQKGRPNKGDILFSKTGSIGHCALVENQELFAITQNAARLVFNKSVYRKYAIYYLRSDYVQNLSNRLAKGNAVKDLQLGDMRKIKFIMPPENLQSEFEEIVNSVEAQKELLNKEIISSENLFNSLLQKAFKGELVK